MKLYLDEMISPRVAEGLRARGHDVVAAVERDTLGRSDARQLAVAIEEQRALVTFDVRDFSIIARAAASARTEHWGIILVPRARFERGEIGALVNALDALLGKLSGPGSLKNRAIFLERA
ncbi:MAG: DUF5615 family PIN-like protein [Acidobacteriota bacterium]